TESYPQASIIRYHFPGNGSRPQVALTWYDGGLMPERPEELEEGRAMGGALGGLLFIGDKGKIMCGSHGADGVRLIPESRMKDYAKPPKTLARSIGHHREWIEACKGDKKTLCNFDYSGALIEHNLLALVSYRLGKPGKRTEKSADKNAPPKEEDVTLGMKLEWDAPSLKATNCPDADQYITKKYRDGWVLNG
ncbi:MAG: gfo/Idh/MocA family oxidoreductase, partial [Planctomycetota bacterium]|nr:gfo/Idh/MocA family oxidoreductase [Planctomycetota bacterium]